MILKPHVTVAALIEHAGRFLLVEEHTDQGVRFNQPAGHLEESESLIEACRREALEETAHDFTPTALVGIYQWRSPDNGVTYLRFAFAGEAFGPLPERVLDDGIIRATWLSLHEIEACRARHRSPLVMRCVEDYRAGKRYPLNLIEHDR